MIHHNHSYLNPDSFRTSQIEALKKGYPDFSENDWVLWLISDFFTQTPDCDGKIQIFKQDGSEVDIPVCIRHPYPNKLYWQFSMKHGRKRLFGIPLVFPSFEALSEIKEIFIRWDCYNIYEFPKADKSGQSSLPTINSFGIRYYLFFEKDPENSAHHWFTVHSSDYDLGPYDLWESIEKECVSNNREYYLPQFDIALYGAWSGTIDFTDRGMVIQNPIYAPYTYDIKNDCELDISIHRALINGGPQALIKENQMIAKLVNYLIEEEGCTDFRSASRKFLWNGYYFERTEMLKAAYMGEVTP